MGTYVRGSLRERFEAKVRREGECWIWIGALRRGGYGCIGVRRSNGMWKIEEAHRVSWELHRGQIAPGLVVRHHCEHLHEGVDYRRCVNPDHLSLGTPRDNAIDMTRRGRRYVPDQRGEKNHRAKLTDEQVALIRELYSSSWTSQAVLAERFGVQQSAISRIINGKRRAS